MQRAKSPTQPASFHNIKNTESISSKKLKSNNFNTTTILDYFKNTGSIAKYRLQYCLAKIAKFFAYIFLLPKKTSDKLDKRCEEHLNKIKNIHLKILFLSAIGNEDLPKVEQLLKENPDISEIKGLALAAIKSQKFEIAGQIFKHGAPIDAEALKIAENLGDKKVFELAKAYTQSYKNGESPLFYVKTKEVLNYLLVHGADVNHVNNDGETPLFKFIRKGQLSFLKETLKFNPDFTIKNNNDESLLHVAYACEQKEMFLAIYNANLKNITSDKLPSEIADYLTKLGIISCNDLINLLLSELDCKKVEDNAHLYFTFVSTIFNSDEVDTSKKYDLIYSWLGIELDRIEASTRLTFLHTAATSRQTVALQNYIKLVNPSQKEKNVALTAAFGINNNIETCLALINSGADIRSSLETLLNSVNEASTSYNIAISLKQILEVLSNPNYSGLLDATINEITSSTKTNVISLLIYYATKHEAVDVLKALKNKEVLYNAKYINGIDNAFEDSLGDKNEEIQNLYKSFQTK